MLGLLDMATAWDIERQGSRCRVVYTTTIHLQHRSAATFYLAAWTDDDSIAYLLALHPAQCRTVMSRLAESPGRKLVGRTFATGHAQRQGARDHRVRRPRAGEHVA